MPWLLFTPGKDRVPIVQEAGWAPGPVWTGAENLAPTGIRSPDGPSRSQSLYRLHYPAHSRLVNLLKFIYTSMTFHTSQFLLFSSSLIAPSNSYSLCSCNVYCLFNVCVLSEVCCDLFGLRTATLYCFYRFLKH